MSGEADDRGVWEEAGYFACGLGRLRYAACGDGPPLILLPKLGGSIAEWRHVLPGLATGRRVVAIDPPGHGETQMWGVPPRVQTVQESAAAIVAALDDAGLDRFSLVGSSLGGCVAIAIASLWPERVARLGLISVSLARRMTRAALARSDAAATGFDADGFPLPRSAADLARFGPMRADIIDEQNRSRAMAGLWLRPCERGAGRFGMEEHLARIAAPTLVLNAEQGHYVQYIDVARRLIGDVRFATVAGSGPFLHQEQPEATLQHLLGFLHADAVQA